MPELPEITNLARQMKAELVGKTIGGIEVLQPKSLNVPEEDFIAALTGAKIRDVSARGKWIFVETTRGWLLLCLGMGGEILLVTRDALPEKRRLVFDFTDGTCLAVNFWWWCLQLTTHRPPTCTAHRQPWLRPRSLTLPLRPAGQSSAYEPQSPRLQPSDQP